MPIDYLSVCQAGALLHLDTEGGRLILTTEGYMDEIADADMGDAGVLAVYDVDPGWLLERLLIELAEAGTDVDAMLRRFEDDPVARLLPSTQPNDPE